MDRLLLACTLILAAGCSALPVAGSTAPSPGTSGAAPAAPPVQSGFDPALTGQRLLESDADFRWREPPTAYTVQEMTYEEAHRYIPMLSADYPPGSPLRRETSVWLVAFRGRWWVTPGGPPGAQPVPYEGCLFVLFTAADSKLVAAGDTTCPGKG